MHGALHLCKQHHLECVNIRTRDCKQLCSYTLGYIAIIYFSTFKVLCTNKLLINKGKHNLVASKSHY